MSFWRHWNLIINEILLNLAQLYGTKCTLKSNLFLFAFKCNIFSIFFMYLFKKPYPVFHFLDFLLFAFIVIIFCLRFGGSVDFLGSSRSVLKALVLVHAALERRSPGHRHRHVGGAGLPVTWGAAGQELPGCPRAGAPRHWVPAFGVQIRQAPVPGPQGELSWSHTALTSPGW